MLRRGTLCYDVGRYVTASSATAFYGVERYVMAWDVMLRRGTSCYGVVRYALGRYVMGSGTTRIL
jgi:hypothetical protein